MSKRTIFTTLKSAGALALGLALAGCGPQDTGSEGAGILEVSLEITNVGPEGPVEVEVFTAEGWLWDVVELSCPGGQCIQTLELQGAAGEGPFEFRPTNAAHKVMEMPEEESAGMEAPGANSSIGNGPVIPPDSAVSIGNGPVRVEKGKGDADG